MGKNTAIRKKLSRIWGNQQTIEHNNQIIRSLKEDLERLRYAAEGLKAIKYDREKVHAAAGDYMPDRVADLIEAQARDAQTIQILAIENNNLSIERAELINAILNLDNPRASEFLYKRYVECKKIGEIQEEMKFQTYNACTNFHAYALKIFWKSEEKKESQDNIKKC